MDSIAGDTKVDFHIHTEHFQGPLDLLLSLIEKRKLFINDFSLSQVADDYIAKVRSFESYPMDDVANFLLIASTLVLIKSKSILPDLNLTVEEEEDIGDLKRRLALHELFKNVAEYIRTCYGRSIIFEKTSRAEHVEIFAPDHTLTSHELHVAAQRVIHALPKKQELPKATIKKVVSIEEMMTRLASRVTENLRMGFSSFSSYTKGRHLPKEEKVHVIISFLAMLELVKQGIVHVTQQQDFDDMSIEPIELHTPKYGQD